MNCQRPSLLRARILAFLPLAVVASACGLLSDDDDALHYSGFYFTGGRGRDDFRVCYVLKQEGGLEAIYLQLDGGVAKRLADLKWEDFDSQDSGSGEEAVRLSDTLRRSGNAAHGKVATGAPGVSESSITFVNEKVDAAHFDSGDWRISGSAKGPFIKFDAFEGEGPTRKQIEAAFGKPMRIGTSPRRHSM